MVSSPSIETQPSGCQYLPEYPTTSDRSPNQFLMPLSAQVNDRGYLAIGGCDVPELVQRYGSPLYIMDEQTLSSACQQYRRAFERHYPGETQVLYASKALNCLAVCAIVDREGLGIDVVSGGELYTALEAGMAADKIYFHGNNKSLEELSLAISAGCTIVVDNQQELETLAGLQADRPIQIMLRLTPGIECHTHDYIRTGHLDSKFGFDPNQVEAVFEFVSKQPGLSLIGLHAHIGSQIFELQPHSDLGGVMVQWFQQATQYGLSPQALNIGGGLGIRYTESDDPPSIDQWVEAVCEGVKKAFSAANVPLPKLLCEPGRSLIGPAGITAYTIGGQKTIPGIRTYLSVDGGMSDNPRPITYQSVYRAVVADRMYAPLTQTVTIAGKHCESGDVLIQTAQLPNTQPGDILVIMATGAYNYSMSSNYNRLARPAAVLVNQGEAHLILERETYQDLIRQDRLPERLRKD